MGTRLWEHRTPAGLEKNRLVYYHSAGIFQAMCCSESGELLLHIIEETDTLPDIQSMLKDGDDPKLECLQMDTSFSFLPKVFKETQMPGLNGHAVSIPLDNALQLHFKGVTGNSHVALPLYLEAKKKAADKENFIFAFIHGGNCFLFFFRNGNCELANAYPVANESEILYYCMTAVKKAGIDVRKVLFELLGNNLNDILTVFNRFVTDAKSSQLELPYPSGEYPPHAAESYLLYQFLTCALPVDR